MAEYDRTTGLAPITGALASYVAGGLIGRGVGLAASLLGRLAVPAARGTALARELGRAGELAAGIVKNTERIASATGTAAYRIPDVLDHSAGIIGEVKNVGSLSYTSQLRDFAAYADTNGYSFELYVRPTTELSAPLQEAVSNGDIVLRYLP
jgi:hypothetical protein